LSTGLKANPDGSAAIQVGGTDVITLTSGGAATFVTSPTTVQAGTAAAPSITFSGDTNTGIYSPGADQVAIATGGSKRFEVDANGNAGLNITPSAWRDVDDVLQVGQGFFGGLATSSSTRRSYMGSNYFTNTSGQDIYIANGEASLYQQNNGSHILYSATSGTAGNAATLTSILDVRLGKALALQGGAVDIAGTGIAFPATQSASSNANILDDYEEGNWTPAGLVSFTSASGRYTKIGRVVQWFAVFTVSVNSNGNHAYAGGLPYACENANAARGGSSISYTDYGSSNITVLFNANDVSAFFYNYSAAPLTYATLSGKTIWCGGTYITNT
jgi:hypothetical protein